VGVQHVGPVAQLVEERLPRPQVARAAPGEAEHADAVLAQALDRLVLAVLVARDVPAHADHGLEAVAVEPPRQLGRQALGAADGADEVDEGDDADRPWHGRPC
jgi:hypothetical protein